MAKILEETPDYFTVVTTGNPFPVPKNKIPLDYQEIMRSKIEPIAPMPQPEMAQIAPQQEPMMQEPVQQMPMAPQQPIAPQPEQSHQIAPITPQVPRRMPAQGGFGQQMGALQNIGALEGQKAVENAKLYGQAIGEVDKIEAQRQQQFNKYQQDMDGQLQDYNKTVQELASAKVDPERFWNSRSMPQKASAFIGIMLSGIGSGMQGVAGNSALNLINRAIDADIDAQKTELDTKSRVLNYKGNLLGLMRQKYQDESTAQAATKATMLEKLQMQMQQQAALYESPLVQERAQLAIGQLKEEKAKYDTQIGMQFQNQALKRLEMDRNHQLDLMKFGLAQDEAQRKVLAGSASEKTTQDQGVAAGYALVAKLANKDLENLKTKGYNRKDFLSSVAASGIYPNALNWGSGPAQDQAEKAFASAYLRATSGSNYKDSELKLEQEKFFPRFGDTPEALRQKNAQREAAIALLESRAGETALNRAYERLNQNKQEKGNFEYLNGEKYRVLPNGRLDKVK